MQLSTAASTSALTPKLDAPNESPVGLSTPEDFLLHAHSDLPEAILRKAGPARCHGGLAASVCLFTTTPYGPLYSATLPLAHAPTRTRLANFNPCAPRPGLFLATFTGTGNRLICVTLRLASQNAYTISLAVYDHLTNGVDIGAYAVQLQLEDAIRALLATDYPQLQELRCTPSVLPAFLPPRSSGDGRLIRKVALNSWSPQKYWTTLSAWPVVARALRSLPHSGGPVRDLTIEAGMFRWRDLVDDGGPYMASLNRLMLILYVAPEDVRFSLPAYSRHSLTL